MEEAIPFYRLLIRQHHAAVLAADAGKVTQLRREAKALALRLNDGEPGILAHPDAPGYVLSRETDRKSTRLNPVTNAHLVCRLLLDKKKKQITIQPKTKNTSHILIPTYAI